MTRFINTCSGFRSLPATLLTLVFAVICLSGCGGPSQKEMLIRAAQRRRAPEPKETAQIQDTGKEQAKASQNDAKPDADQQISPAANGISVKPARGQLAISGQPAAKPPKQSETKRTLSVQPIEQRQPSTELNKTERRKVAQRNIETVANALQQYFAETKRLPQSYKQTQTNFPRSHGESLCCHILATKIYINNLTSPNHGMSSPTNHCCNTSQTPMFRLSVSTQNKFPSTRG